MDEIRDIQRRGDLSKILDSYSVRTNPFGTNRSAERIYRRAERITAALHILTSHVSHHEPARGRMRSLSLDLLSLVLSTKNDLRVSDSEKVSEIELVIRNLISLVKILAVSGYVSAQNTEAACGALDELTILLRSSQRSASSESVRYTKEDLMDINESSLDLIRDKTDISRRISKGQSMDNEGRTKDAQYKGSTSGTVRSEGILSILRDQGELGIKDVVSHLPEYSEKMIQRELSRLVVQGKVKKVGLKRWSRYSLA